MICPLCQNDFDESKACQGCGLNKNCNMLKCPHCSYEFVEKSSVIDFFKKLFNRLRQKKNQEK